MMVWRIDRTSVWRALGGNALALPIAALLALTFGTAGVTPAGATTFVTDDHATQEGDGHDHGDDHDHDASAAMPTAEEQLVADQLVAATQAAAIRFADFAVAEAEGYVQVTPYVLGRGPAHYVNPTYAADGVYLDPDRPESLVYLRSRDGETHLLGVMYLAPTGEGPTPGGPLTHWHGHEGLCTGPYGLSQADETGACPPGQVLITQEMMHVWTFDHPRGPLAEELGRDGLVAAYREFVL